MLGSDYQHRNTDVDWANNYTDVSPLNVKNPIYSQNAYSYNEYVQNSRLKLNQLGFYLRDNMQWNQWHAELGVRHDKVKTSSTNLPTGIKQSEWSGNKTTWNASLLYALENGISPYISYSTGFNPNTYSDENGKLLRPTESEQWEGGVKYQPLGTNNLYTVALYNLQQKNVANRVINGGYYVPTGQVHSKGIEAEAKISLTDKWFLQGALAYNHAEFKNTTTGLDGKTPYQAPKLTASIWSNYKFNNGFDVNAGIRHVRGIWADHENTVKIPTYTLVDLGMRYNFGVLNPKLKGLQGSISVNNLFDKTYVSSCATLSYCYYGEGRNILGNISYRW